MGLLSKLFKPKAVSQSVNKLADPITSPVIGVYSTGKRDYFDNIYDNAIALAKGFARVEPYMVNSRGNRLAGRQPIIEALYNPLEGISAYQFRKMLALMTVTHNKFYILIHTKSDSFLDNPNESDIVGFEMLQPGQVHKPDYDSNVYSVNTGREMIEVSDKRMMCMTDVLDPFDLTRGYSTLKAVRKWATLDDFIISYQHGLFLNGAVPQGIFNIRANKEDYETIAKTIQRTMRTNQSNGVLFNHIPLNAAGKDMQSTIEWVPMSSSNKDMSVTDLQTANTRKIDSNFGVPQEIRGYLQNSNYASVRVAELVFEKYDVEDLLMAIWSKFNAELNRCTGGFGKAISYDHELPIIADEEKVRAEAQQLDLQNIASLQQQGYSLAAIVNALGLSKRYLELGEPSQQPQTVPEVQNSNEEAKAVTDINVKSAYDDAEDRDGQTDYFDIPDVDLGKYEAALETIAHSAINKQVKRAIEALDGSDRKKDADVDYIQLAMNQYYHPEEDDAELEDEMLIPIMICIIMSGRDYVTAANSYLISLGATAEVPRFTAGDQRLMRTINNYVTNPTNQNYQELIATAKMSRSSLAKYYVDHTSELSKSYNQETADAIHGLIEKAVASQTPQNKIIEQLQNLGLETYRAKRLADTEIHRLKNSVFEYVCGLMSNAVNVPMEKTIIPRGPNPCSFCISLSGRWIPLNAEFVAKGETITAMDGKTRVNSYEPITSAHIHPHCECGTRVRFVRSLVAV